MGYLWHIVDKVVVPEKEGEYVLSWRLDCEQTPQIWTNCADIRIVAGPSPDGTTAASSAVSLSICLVKMVLSVTLVTLCFSQTF